MEAGRELDALVAEKVMGLEVQRDQVTRRWFDRPASDDPWAWFLGASNDLVPSFSTDIAAAWLVVEKLRERYTDVALFAGNGWGLSCWNVTWTEDHGVMEDGVTPITADTAPLAICLAALKACESSVSPDGVKVASHLSTK